MGFLVWGLTRRVYKANLGYNFADDISKEKGLSQPIEIQLSNNRWVKNFYDGSGRLYKTSYSTGEYWEYLDGMVFKNGAFYQLASPEGRAVYQSGGWSYEYFHTDHLGNTRVAYKANGTALAKTSETSFDPWGVILNGINFLNSYQNRFEFLNREKESTFNLNAIRLGARMYNPTIGRFDRVDPIADEQENYSPYQYGWNNPIVNSDPNGLCPSCPQGEEAAKLYAPGAIVTNKDGSWQWTGSRWNDFNSSFANRSPFLNPTGAQVMEPVSGFWGWADHILNGRSYENQKVDSQGKLTGSIQPITGEAPNVGLSKGTGILKLLKSLKEFRNAKSAFKLEGQLEAIWNDRKLFLNWLKNNHSLSRVSTKLNASEAQQIIDNAKALGLPIENNLKGLQGLEITGQWAGIPHFKVGNVHIPIDFGLETILKF